MRLRTRALIPTTPVRWRLSHRFDSDALPLADAHYNRQKPGTPQFMPPGRCLVLLAGEGPNALWGTSWPFAQFTKHRWAGAWVCSIFRNQGAGLSSELVLEAVAVTRYRWPEVPPLGMVTFVNPSQVKSVIPGYCFIVAGFEFDGYTEGGLLAYRMKPERMPAPRPAMGAQLAFGDDLVFEAPANGNADGMRVCA